MPHIDRFEELESWRSGSQLRHTVYQFTRIKPFSTDYALVSQIRRAALSVTANIAESFERGGNREFLQFLSQAKGSVGEVKDQLYAALDEGYITDETFKSAYELADRATRLIGGLMSYLRQSGKSGAKFVSRQPPNPELRTLNPC
jgi:four helix bundle protein